MREDIPWRCSFLIQGEGLQTIQYKSVLSKVLHFASTTNKQFNQAVENLRERELQNDTIVKLQVMFVTWGDSKDELKTRSNQLASAIQGWGTCQVSSVTGDPLLGFSATIPGYMTENPAPAAAAPLEDSIEMLPLTRPASVWSSGSVPFRSADGKIMPYEQGSSKQDAWIDIGFAPMGGGKSVLLNTLNFCFCLKGGLKELPYLSVIDIGPSSSGLISLLKGALPSDKEHLAAYHRLQMTEEYSINPFDTPLGVTEPLPSHKSFLVNFLSLLATPLQEDAPPEGVTGVAQNCVEAAYDQLAPDRKPRKFNDQVNETVTEAIERTGMELDQQTTWWEVVNHLYDQGLKHEATIAQRYAVPTVGDVAAQARKDNITGMYSHETVQGEPITDFFRRRCVESLNKYPILKNPTQFDLGDAKIISLDLDEVAPKGSAPAKRQTAVMYMLARHLSISKFYMMPEHLSMIPEKFRDHHRERVENIREQPKRICFDEFHRVSDNGLVSSQLETDIREGRKWNMHIGLYSQDIRDFSDIMLELAYSVFVLGAGSEKTVERFTERFSLNDVARKSLLQKTGNPDASGANMLTVFKTSEGRITQLMTNTLGPKLLWAFNTTTEDVAVRNELYRKIGPKATRELLSQEFPGGIKEEVERLNENSDVIEELGQDEEVLDVIVNRLIDKAEEKGISTSLLS
jgi:intracellular multiplication protein IcmB